jgi:ribosomal protein S18 acetylase RimI-like enzyme
VIAFADLPPLRESVGELQACGEDVWLCEEAGELVGAVGVEDLGDALLIARLMVEPGAMRRGVGTALVRRVLALAGERAVRVGTAAANAPALALYERLGFRRVGERSVGPGLAYVDLVRDGAKP